jgi:hypothetical protein
MVEHQRRAGFDGLRGVLARVVFAVARARTQEPWNPVGCATLWSLPPEVEDEFEDHWQR